MHNYNHELRNSQLEDSIRSSILLASPINPTLISGTNRVEPKL
jgi:hypothetical protein